MTTTKLSVPDISCDHCKHSIEGAVSQVPGVSKVAVDVPTKTVEVEFDDSAMEAIVEAIEEQGYEVAR